MLDTLVLIKFDTADEDEPDEDEPDEDEPDEDEPSENEPDEEFNVDITVDTNVSLYLIAKGRGTCHFIMF